MDNLWKGKSMGVRQVRLISFGICVGILLCCLWGVILFWFSGHATTVVHHEVCNGVDDDGDGAVDEMPAEGAKTWYLDLDGDGCSGPRTTTVLSCQRPYPGFITTAPGTCVQTLWVGFSCSLVRFSNRGRCFFMAFFRPCFFILLVFCDKIIANINIVLCLKP